KWTTLWVTSWFPLCTGLILGFSTFLGHWKKIVPTYRSHRESHLNSNSKSFEDFEFHWKSLMRYWSFRTSATMSSLTLATVDGHSSDMGLNSQSAKESK